MRIVFFSLLLVIANIPYVLADDVQNNAQILHDKACAIEPYVADDPWHIANLYNCSTRQLFIPYQLWTGAQWKGDKNAPCMHEINNRNVLERPSDSYARGEVIIKGPIEWLNPFSGNVLSVWERQRPHRNASKYYLCHERGIGSIHNLRKPKEQFVEGLCQAPGGHGWMIGKRRTCIKVTLEIIDLGLDDNNHLSSLKVKYWWRDKLRYIFTYLPNEGVKSIYAYPR